MTIEKMEKNLFFSRDPTNTEYTLRHTPKTKKTPFGYKIWPVNSLYCEPIPSQIELLYQAFVYLDRGCSWRETAKWLTRKSGRALTHMGLKKIYLRHKTEIADREEVLLRRARRVARTKTNIDAAIESYNEEYLKAAFEGVKTEAG